MNKLDLLQIYKYASCLLFALFLLGFLLSFQGDQWHIFFYKGHALLSDFFNISRFIADNNPYFNNICNDLDKAYLPIAYLIIKLFTFYVDYTGLDQRDCYFNSGAMIQALLFVFLSWALFAHSLKKNGASNTLIVLASISAPAIFQYERGNLIMISVACINYYLAYYNHDGARRYIGLTLFCLSIALKVYPVILGFMLLKDKRYKDIVFCIIITVIFIVIPFFFFENGFANFPVMMRNVSLNSDYFYAYTTTARFGIHSLVSLYFTAIHSLDTYLFKFCMNLSRVITIILCILSICLFFFEKEKWKQIAFLTFPLLMFPIASHFYCGLYIFPVLFAFLHKNSSQIMGKMDYYYLFLFVVALSPLQIVIKNFSISGYLSDCVLLVMWIMIISETIWNRYNLIRKKC